MTPETMAGGVDEGDIKRRSADNGGAEESAGKHNNQMGTGVGANKDNARMLLSWMTGACGMDDGGQTHGG